MAVDIFIQFLYTAVVTLTMSNCDTGLNLIHADEKTNKPDLFNKQEKLIH